MGLPSQLDGLPQSLKPKKPYLCPHCRKVIDLFMVKGTPDKIKCPKCGKEIVLGDKLKN